MIDDFYGHEPYDLDKSAKNALVTKELVELTKFHRENCLEYKRFLAAIGFDEKNVKSVSDIPFFPVRLFKNVDLLSIPRDEVLKKPQ